MAYSIILLVFIDIFWHNFFNLMVRVSFNYDKAAFRYVFSTLSVEHSSRISYPVRFSCISVLCETKNKLLSIKRTLVTLRVVLRQIGIDVKGKFTIFFITLENVFPIKKLSERLLLTI